MKIFIILLVLCTSCSVQFQGKENSSDNYIEDIDAGDGGADE